jgi:hypothetical protein
MMDNTTTKDFHEWKHQVQRNCTWRDYDLYFDIQEIIPHINGYLTFSDSCDPEVENGTLISDSMNFSNYQDLVEHIKSSSKRKYLHSVLKHKQEERYCLWMATA